MKLLHQEFFLLSAFPSFLIAAMSLLPLANADEADDFELTKEKLEIALKMDHRSIENQNRDQNRNPLAAMEFCRLRDDMTVIEFGPGSGWYTEILGPVLREKARLYIVYKESWMEKFDSLLAQDYMSAVEKHPIDMSWNSEDKIFNFGDFVYDIENADLALNIREYHNLGEEGVKRLNEATYQALRPGGYYCIIDHTRRHMELRYTENRRRVDPVSVILQVQAVGFDFVDYSDIFFKPDDELRFEVGRKSVAGNTDRFSLLFRKPFD
jgi:predicted methyltransferase